MKVLSLFVCLLMLSVSPLTASAAPLNLAFELTDQVTTSIVSLPPIFTKTYNTIGVDFPASFDGDLSQSDSIVWESVAPNNGRYVVDTPNTGVNQLLAEFYVVSGGSVGASAVAGSVTFELLGVQGAAPTFNSYYTAFRAGGEQISSWVSFNVSGPFSFTGIRYTINGPLQGSQTLTYDQYLIEPSISLTNDQGANPPLDTQFVTYIPEPASAGVIALGVVLLLGRERGLESIGPGGGRKGAGSLIGCPGGHGQRRAGWRTTS